MSNWLDYNGWSGAAKLYKNYYNDEISHRDKFIEYLLDLDALPMPINDCDGEISKEYKNIEDVINLTYDRECMTTENIKNLKTAAYKESDFITIDFLDFFINEQIEELSKTMYWIDRVSMFKETNTPLSFLDKEMEAKA